MAIDLNSLLDFGMGTIFDCFHSSEKEDIVKTVLIKYVKYGKSLGALVFINKGCRSSEPIVRQQYANVLERREIISNEIQIKKIYGEQKKVHKW